MSTLPERIQWILDNCRAPDGGRWNAKKLSLAAGLADAHVGMLRRGTVKGGNASTLRKIARAAGVNTAWLIDGAGRPFDAETPEHTTEREEPQFQSLPQWKQLLATAKALAPEIPSEAFEAVGRSYPLLVGPVTPGLIVDLARVVMKHSAPVGGRRGTR